jgi:uncharacterized protein YecE (DUF72 family)
LIIVISPLTYITSFQCYYEKLATDNPQSTSSGLSWCLNVHLYTKTRIIQRSLREKIDEPEAPSYNTTVNSKIHIGTSGWNYDHWREVFYPKDRPKSKWLEFYTQHYQTVELNASFYRLPKPQTFENWREKTPDKFVWAVKANRYITHIKRINDVQEPLEKFFSAADCLREKLGPVLFQLPPNLSFDETVLCSLCETLPDNHRYALEVRHPSWEQPRAIDILRHYNIALCISDTAGRYPYIEEDTATFIYIRLHGSKKLYTSEYTEEELRAYAQKIRDWSKDVYVYFDNDYGGYAIKNARRLKEILGLP